MNNIQDYREILHIYCDIYKIAFQANFQILF
jgi:hypothetical protein